MQIGSNSICGCGDVAEVRLVALIQGSRHTDDDRIHMPDMTVIRSGCEPLVSGRLNIGRGNAKNVRFSAGKGGDFAGINIKAGHLKTLLGKQQGQRQADVPQTNEPDARRAVVNLCMEILSDRN